MAMITMIGLYNYNENLFDKLVLPAGIDRDTLIENILLRSGDFEVLYPDVDFLSDAIGLWARKWLRTFTKWYDALQIDYNPLENYDRIEDSNDVNTNAGTIKDNSTSNASIGSESKTSAYDSNAYEPHDRTDGTNHTTTDATNTVDSKGTTTHHARLHGNIGVTTSQQMLQSELDIAVWNLYDHITDLFLSEFIIQVY